MSKEIIPLEKEKALIKRKASLRDMDGTVKVVISRLSP